MLLIIACGNSLRGDDGGGLALAEILEQKYRAQAVDVKRIAVHQLVPELAAEIAQDDVEAVLFVDTRVVTPEEADLSLRVRPVTPAHSSQSVGHHLDPTVLLTYADLLYNKQAPAWEVTIPGIDFDHGETFSPMTQAALTIAERSSLPHIKY